MPQALEIRLLGEPAVLHQGRPHVLPASKKTRALLVYLAHESSPQARSRLCELLWDGPVDPRAELRWSLSKLRALVDTADSRRIQAEREHVTLATPPGAEKSAMVTLQTQIYGSAIKANKERTGG